MIEVLQRVAQGRIKGASVRDRVAAASALIDKVIPNMRHIAMDTTVRAETIFVGPGADEAADEEIKRIGAKSGRPRTPDNRSAVRPASRSTPPSQRAKRRENR